MDIVIADFNGDHHLDVAVANSGSKNVSILDGDGTGALAAAVKFAVGVHPTALAIGDLNGDGILDLAVSNQVSRFVSVLLGTGSTAAAPFQTQLRIALPGSHSASSIVIGDFNGDGRADLGLGNTLGDSFTILLATGPATYSQPYEFSLGTDIKHSATGGIAVTDLNNDGQLDLIATSTNSNDVRVLLRNG